MKTRSLRIATVLAGLLLSIEAALATDWFVGDLSSPGNNTGTSANNPWKGYNAIVWGANGVKAGDTLYVVGTMYMNGAFFVVPESGNDPTTGNGPIVISGRAPDPNVPGAFLPQATIIGNHGSYTYDPATFDSQVWTTVYGTAGAGDRVFRLESTGGNAVVTVQIIEEDITAATPTFRRLKQETFTGTTPDLPYDQWLPGTVGISDESPAGKVIVYKPTDPDQPGNFRISTQVSEIFTITDNSYITIRDLTILAMGARAIKLGNADNITIERCDISGTNGYPLIYSTGYSDNGVIMDNHLHDAAAGIWLYTDGTAKNAASNDFWEISGNHIHDLNQYGRFDSIDPHGIGIQGGNNILIEKNLIHNIQRSGITFYIFTTNTEGGTTTVGQDNRNNIIRYNTVHDIYDLRDSCLDGGTCTTQRGIELGGDYPSPQPGTMDNNIVHHNLVYDIGRIAFRFKTGPQPAGPAWRLENNVVVNAGEIGLEFKQGTDFHNNIVVDSGQFHLHAMESIGSNDITANLYYPALNTAGGDTFKLQNTVYNFTDWKTNTGLDASSVIADPRFVDLPGRDFHLLPGSPAIDAGVDVNLTEDIDGNGLQGPPDAGAYEFGGTDSDNDALTDYAEVCLDGNCQTYDPYDPVSNPTGGDLDINRSDTDGDGYRDGTEVNLGSDPLDAGSTPSVAADGDLNLDGSLGVADLLLAYRQLFGLASLSPEQLDHGDLYPAGGDGVVNISDIILLHKQLFSQ